MGLKFSPLVDSQFCHPGGKLRRHGEAINNEAANPFMGRLPPQGHAPEVGELVHDRPDADAAIKAAIEKYELPPNELGRLTAPQRD